MPGRGLRLSTRRRGVGYGGSGLPQSRQLRGLLAYPPLKGCDSINELCMVVASVVCWGCRVPSRLINLMMVV